MKKIVALVLPALLLLIIGSQARAELVLKLDQSSLSALPGHTVTFSGNLWYEIVGSTPTSGGIPTGTFSSLYLNGADFPLLQTGLSGSVQPFIDNAPLTMMPNQTLPGSIDLFTVKVNSGVKPGIYEGSFRVLGGRTETSYDELARVGFLVTVGQSSVPEPGVVALLSAALITSGLVVRRRRK